MARIYKAVGLRELPCQACGRSFSAKRSDAKWCPECRKMAADGAHPRIRAHGATPRKRHALRCVNCHKRFSAIRNDAQRCPACKADRRREISRDAERQRIDTCPRCGGPKYTRAEKCMRCDGVRRGKAQTGERNPFWRGGRTSHQGYVAILLPRGRQRYTLEHTAVWESANGPLPKGWVVHHLNGIKTDNRIENLAGMTRNEHHSHPRKALMPYEARIRELERALGILPPVPPE